MTTFITTLPASGSGIRLAVKDLIDVAGVPGSLQLIGGPGAEALLLATGAIIEAAVGGPAGLWP